MSTYDDLLAIGIIIAILAAVGIPLFFLVRWIIFKINGKAAHSPSVDRKTTVNFLKDRIFGRRDGQIVFWSSIIYLLIFASTRTLFTEKEWFSFIFWLGQYMPIFLFGFYLKMGGFGESYESSNFSTALISLVAIVPIITTIWSAID